MQSGLELGCISFTNDTIALSCFKFLFIYGCAGSSSKVHSNIEGCGKQGLLSIYGSGFSLWWLLLKSAGLQGHGLRSMWDI